MTVKLPPNVPRGTFGGLLIRESPNSTEFRHCGFDPQ